MEPLRLVADLGGHFDESQLTEIAEETDQKRSNGVNGERNGDTACDAREAGHDEMKAR
jgi:hypothetical protein